MKGTKANPWLSRRYSVECAGSTEHIDTEVAVSGIMEPCGDAAPQAQFWTRRKGALEKAWRVGRIVLLGET